jgi:hypothetical protein
MWAVRGRAAKAQLDAAFTALAAWIDRVSTPTDPADRALVEAELEAGDRDA